MEKNVQETLDVALNSLGSAINEIVETALTVEDVVLKSSKPVQFIADGEKGSYGQGLQWKGEGPTKQFIYRANPDRIWTSESIDINEGQSYCISNTPVLSLHELGSSVRISNLTSVGTLQNLRTQGDLVIDDYIYYNSTLDALGIGTEAPNGKLSIATLDAEFIVDTDPGLVKIGTWTTSDLDIITDDTVRIKVERSGTVTVKEKLVVEGQIGIGVKNFNTDADLTVAGAIRFQNKKFESAEGMPSVGTYEKGDIIWNSEPRPTSYVGWICIKSGTPGEWKPFGQIGS